MMGVPSSENVLQVTLASQGDTFAELGAFTALGLFLLLIATQESGWHPDGHSHILPNLHQVKLDKSWDTPEKRDQPAFISLYHLIEDTWLYLEPPDSCIHTLLLSLTVSSREVFLPGWGADAQLHPLCRQYEASFLATMCKARY
jgi:hypothetical protein